MRRFRAGLFAAALASAVALPLGAVSALAQSQASDQAHGAATAPPQNQIQNQVQNQAQNSPQACPENPSAIGTSRVLPVDFSEYQRLGRMQYPDSLLLNDKEVVITFDDGPLPPYTDQVLDILASQCVKATFFMVGEMARSFPATARRVYQQGHTIGTHSDHHPIGFGKLPTDRMRAEIDGGIADVSGAFGGDSRYLAPFFRIPGLERSDPLESELAARGLIVFSADVVADDWHRDITPGRIVSLALSRLEKAGKGILLLHDIHPKTVAALPGLLQQLKQNGFHIVQVVPSAAYEIAMARKPAARMVASAMPDELTIDNTDASSPSWPQATDDLAADRVVLPVPDAAAFEPDAGLAADSGTVQWPDLPLAVVATPGRHSAMPNREHRRMAAHPQRRKLHVARSVDHARMKRHTERSRAHARTGAEGHRADLVSGVHALAALFSPAQTAR
jgi:peptidoglycan/xylan/chitin deacetylase (PgdA/CDA1 family)